MFRHQGPARSARDNRRVAAYLAFTGGYVNSAGFVLIGVFTSHVTGNVGRFADDVVRRDAPASIGALAMIAAFFAGAFVASMMVESNFFGHSSSAYGVAMLAETGALAVFLMTSHLGAETDPRHQDAKALLLCLAMGMQNSLVTRLSGAVVRTTHLTGVTTDLAIEAARWFRWWRACASEVLRFKLSLGGNPAERPHPERSRLLLTIAGAFVFGAVFGAFMSASFRADAMLLPTCGVALCAVYALLTGRRAKQLSIRPSSS